MSRNSGTAASVRIRHHRLALQTPDTSTKTRSSFQSVVNPNNLVKNAARSAKDNFNMARIDRIYRDPPRQLVDFAFDESVAEVFPDMIRRSVPGYELVVPLTGLLAARHLAATTPVKTIPTVPKNSRRTNADHRACTTSTEKDRPAVTSNTKDGRPAVTSNTKDGRPAVTSNTKDGLPADTTSTQDGRPATYEPLVFDLGCSLGATTLALLRQLGERPCRIIGVDNAKSMLDRAPEQVDDGRVEFRLQDIRETDVSGANVILMNYALQFIPRGDRQPLLRRFREQMAPGGLLVLSEKIEFVDAEDQAFFDQAHLAFKKANGYSDLEVGQKRAALENVMRIDTEETHIERLRKAGFSKERIWFRCLNWASILAWADCN